MKKATIGLLLLIWVGIQTQAQTQVVLDHYFNNEFNVSGEPFHYLWTDKENSGFSQWGNIFKDNGATISTLEAAPRKNNLSTADIYIIVDPDTRAETASPNFVQKKDIRALTKWVKKGGVLVLMANDSGNSEFKHFNELAKSFGMHFNEVSLKHVTGQQWEMGAFTDLPNNPIFLGVEKIYIKEASSLTLSGSAKPVLTQDGHVFMALNRVGRGYVFAVTDPWIYNEYIGHKYLPESFQNHEAAENLTRYLIQLSKKGRTDE